MCSGHRASDRGGMTTLSSPQSLSASTAAAVVPDPSQTTPLDTTPSDTTPSDTPRTPRRWRRAAIATTGAIACLMPVVFTFNITRMLVTGAESEHQFHQATGQGLVLTALWLGALLPLVRAGWSGRRPPLSAGLLHLAFVLIGAACAAFSPGGGAPILMAIIAVPGALLWAALPQRPRLQARVQLDPVLAPVALLAAALFTPFAIEQIGLQNAATGYHAQNPHYFDMAWMTLTLTACALLAAVLPAARRLALWLVVGAVTTGAAGLVFGEGVRWSLLVLALGLVSGVAVAARDRLGRTR